MGLRVLSTRSVGERGEDLAMRYLAGKGYSLVERNYRTRRGEVDLVVRRENVLVFVEVKLRRGSSFGDPLEAVTPRKQGRLRLAAEEYLAELAEEVLLGLDEIRFDVVGIRVRGGGLPEFRHVENAF